MSINFSEYLDYENTSFNTGELGDGSQIETKITYKIRRPLPFSDEEFENLLKEKFNEERRAPHRIYSLILGFNDDNLSAYNLDLYIHPNDTLNINFELGIEDPTQFNLQANKSKLVKTINNIISQTETGEGKKNKKNKKYSKIRVTKHTKRTHTTRHKIKHKRHKKYNKSRKSKH